MRDPRTDPIPGDFLKRPRANSIPRLVTWRNTNRVFYRYMEAQEYSLTLNGWRKWAAGAEVLKAARMDGGGAEF